MKNKSRGFLLGEWFLTKPEVVDFIEHEGAAGAGKLLVMAEHLVNCDNTIGTKGDLCYVTSRIKTRLFKMKEMIHNRDLFSCRMIDGREIFALRPLRVMFGLCPDITDEEVEFIRKNGNKSRKLRNTEYGKYRADESADGLQTVCRQSADKGNTDVSLSANRVQKLQPADSKGVKCSSIVIEDNNKDIHDITESNSNVNEYINQRKNGAAGDESSFKFFEQKIFNDTVWRKAVSMSHGINIDDDFVMHVFYEWMHSYCISKNSFPASAEEIESYASNLLVKGRNTRKMFELQLHRALEDDAAMPDNCCAEAADVGMPAAKGVCSYETVENGQRYGLGHLPLPDYAPHQTDIRWRWSYIQDRYIDKSVFDRKREIAELHRQQRRRREDGQSAKDVLHGPGGSAAAGTDDGRGGAADRCGGGPVPVSSVIMNSIIPSMLDKRRAAGSAAPLAKGTARGKDGRKSRNNKQQKS